MEFKLKEGEHLILNEGGQQLDVTTTIVDVSDKVDKTVEINGHALTGNVTVSKSDVGLGNVGNFKAVSTEASQGLTSTEQSNARANIGAGTSSLVLGETETTAYRGDRGKTAYDHSQAAHARTDATKVESSTTNGKIKINGTETTVYTHPSGTNPHGTTKSDVELGNVTNDAQVKRSEMGVSGGVATLDSAGKVPTSQLPSYVDDVLEYASLSSFPTTGESGKIYVALDTNKTYRWSSTAYVEISASLALGTTSSTAYYGDKGKTAYDHSQTAHARTDATNTNVSYDTTNKKITKSVNGAASDVVSASTIVSDGKGVTSSTSGLKIEIVSSMPSSPDANTIYIVQ